MSENFAEDIYSDLAAGRVEELAEIYATDAITEAERAAIDDHLAKAELSVRQEFEDRVRQARETLAIAYANFDEEPPASLLAKIQSAIAEQEVPNTVESPVSQSTVSGPSVSPATFSPATGSEPNVPGVDEPGVDEPGVDDLTTRRTKRSSVRTWLIGAAAAAVIAVAGAFGVNGIIQAQDPVNQVISASDVRVIDVPVQGGGQAKVSISENKNAAVLRMDSVPAPAAGKTYQLWILPQGGTSPVSLGLMSSSADLGKPTLVDGIGTGQALAITVEPAGGSETPTTIPVMMAQLHP